MKTKFYLCNVCGNVIVKYVDSGVTPFCCGEQMTELVPQSTETVKEKHLPVLERVDDCTVRVKVGVLPHPMSNEHSIRFIFLETENGGMLRYLNPDGPAEACFCICKEKPVAVYEYCNIHGLWKSDCSLSDEKKTCCSTKKGDCK